MNYWPIVSHLVALYLGTVLAIVSVSFVGYKVRPELLEFARSMNPIELCLRLFFWPITYVHFLSQPGAVDNVRDAVTREETFAPYLEICQPERLSCFHCANLNQCCHGVRLVEHCAECPAPEKRA